MTNEPDELQHVIECMIAMREAKEEARKRFGFTTWKAFEEAQILVMGAIPEGGIIQGKYRIIKATKQKFLVKADSATTYSTTRLEIHNAR